MRLTMRLLAAVYCLLAGLQAAAAQAEKRVALVIGNARYEHIPALPNVPNDAKAMAALFEAAKFDSVVVLHDKRVAELRRELLEFAERAAGADVAVVFYAGHGIEVDRVNYLIPVDARLKSDLAVKDETVSLERVLELMEPARKLRVVILDACRENPFAKSMKLTVPTRSATRGLGRIEAGGANTLIAFATEPNAVAEDGTGPNSPFTAALLKHLATPGLDLRLALGSVRDEVMASTGKKQRPYVTSSLGGGVIALRPAVSGATGPSSVEVAQFCQSVAANPSLTPVEALLPAYRGTPMALCIEVRIAQLRKHTLHVSPAPVGKAERTPELEKAEKTAPAACRLPVLPPVAVTPEYMMNRARHYHRVLGEESPGINEIYSFLINRNEDLFRTRMSLLCTQWVFYQRNRLFDYVQARGSAIKDALDIINKLSIAELEEASAGEPLAYIKRREAEIKDEMDAAAARKEAIARKKSDDKATKYLDEMFRRSEILRAYPKGVLERLIQEMKQREREDIPFLDKNALDTITMMISPIQWYRRQNLIDPMYHGRFFPGDNNYDQAVWFYSQQNADVAIKALDRAVDELKETNLLNAIQYVTNIVDTSPYHVALQNSQAILDVPPYTGWIPYILIVGALIRVVGRAVARRGGTPTATPYRSAELRKHDNFTR